MNFSFIFLFFITTVLTLFNLKKVSSSNDEIKYAAVIYRNKSFMTSAWREEPFWPVQFGPWLDERYSHLLLHTPSETSETENSAVVDEPSYNISLSENAPLSLPMLKEIFKLMENVICNDSNDRNINYYSADNNTLAHLLTTLEIFNSNYSIYEDAIIIELVGSETENNTGTDYIRIFYINVLGTEEPHFLNISKCGTRCSEQMFKKIYKNIFTGSCKKYPLKGKNVLFSIFVIMAVVFYALACLFKKQNLQNEDVSMSTAQTASRSITLTVLQDGDGDASK